METTDGTRTYKDHCVEETYKGTTYRCRCSSIVGYRIQCDKTFKGYPLGIRGAAKEKSTEPSGPLDHAADR